MKFSYANLKSADYSGDRVGNWKGYPVFAATKFGLNEKASGAYFIVYDDDNEIVRKIDGDWYSFGQCSEGGQVLEWDRRRKYSTVATAYSYRSEEAHAVCGKTADECDGTAAAAEEVVGDVKIGIDVDAVLKNAREMTVDSLLEGFDYGLEAKG